MNVNSLSNKKDSWPKRLNNLHDPPKQLSIAGKIPNGPRVAIVGARRCTQYGLTVTELFSHQLAQAGIVVVSGLAIGIDSVAHRAALGAGGTSIAVLPSSIDTIYPKRHTNLAHAIAQAGALISEYPKKHWPHPHDFIARNRIVAALADVLLVTEATIQSGTSHTVRFALDLGIDVAAVPGPVTSRLSSGTNHIIKQGGHLVDSVQDILQLLRLPTHAQDNKPAQSSNHQMILDLLGAQPAHTSLLHEISKLDIEQLSTILAELEASGQVARSHDGVYALRSNS